MNAVLKKDIPSLGNNLHEVLEAWAGLTAFPGETIVAVCFGVGEMAIRVGIGGRYEFEICEAHRVSGGSFVSTVRPATDEEKDDLLEGIEKGWVDIVGQKIRGCLGVRKFDDAGKVMRRYHQATGKALEG